MGGRGRLPSGCNAGGAGAALDRDHLVAQRAARVGVEVGSEIHPELVSRTFDRLARDADLPPSWLHDLRHRAVTVAPGIDLKVVSAMLRRSPITITANTYVSVLSESARAAAEAAAAVIPRRGRSGPTLVPHDLETTLGSLSTERKPTSVGVRRQGLEPRTR